MPKLVIDIETVGKNFDSFDQTTKDDLTRWLKKEVKSEEAYQSALEELKQEMGLSPLTGSICAIGMLDCEKNKGAVYFEAPGEDLPDFEEGKFKFKPVDEKTMLEKFWEIAEKYDTFITFNGRGFDVPFIIARSAVHGVKISRDLMSNRYLSGQRGPTHIDLLDQLSFYGSTKRSSLHLWCQALGIKSPKAEGVNGNDVARLFEEKKYIDIARYNTRDLIATQELYNRWQNFMIC